MLSEPALIHVVRCLLLPSFASPSLYTTQRHRQTAGPAREHVVFPAAAAARVARQTGPNASIHEGALRCSNLVHLVVFVGLKIRTHAHFVAPQSSLPWQMKGPPGVAAAQGGNIESSHYDDSGHSSGFQSKASSRGVSKEFDDDQSRSYSHSGSGQGQGQGAGGPLPHRNPTRASSKGSPRPDNSGTDLRFFRILAACSVHRHYPLHIPYVFFFLCCASHAAGSGSGPSSNLSPQSAHSAAEAARRRASNVSGRNGPPQARPAALKCDPQRTVCVSVCPSSMVCFPLLSLCGGSIRRRLYTPRPWSPRPSSTRRLALSAASPATTLSPGGTSFPSMWPRGWHPPDSRASCLKLPLVLSCPWQSKPQSRRESSRLATEQRRPAWHGAHSHAFPQPILALVLMLTPWPLSSCPAPCLRGHDVDRTRTCPTNPCPRSPPERWYASLSIPYLAPTREMVRGVNTPDNIVAFVSPSFFVRPAVTLTGLILPLLSSPLCCVCTCRCEANCLTPAARWCQGPRRPRPSRPASCRPCSTAGRRSARKTRFRGWTVNS